jgi:hypothetical protein
MDKQILDLEAAAKGAGEIFCWVLENLVREAGEVATGYRMHCQAEFRALFSLVVELAAHAGAFQKSGFQPLSGNGFVISCTRVLSMPPIPLSSLKGRFAKLYDEEGATTSADGFEPLFQD